MEDLKSLLGDDLLWRVRHGNILIQGRWIHFPLKPVDLVTRLPKSFMGSLALDTFRKLLPAAKPAEENFATVLRRGLGKTMAESFYFPYARKLWGLAPEDLAVTTAERRVSGSSVGKIIRKVLGQVPGLKSKTAGRFYYFRRGYGQISECLQQAAERHGAAFCFNSRIGGLSHDGTRVTEVHFDTNGVSGSTPVDAVWSTLPISVLAKMFRPAPPSEVLDAVSKIRYRGMILIYLVLEQSQFSGIDAYYFPEERIPITRMSEPKNFSGSVEPKDRTVLCAELPVDCDGPEWKLSDQELGDQLQTWLASVRLPIKARVQRVLTRRLRFAYPIYDRDYLRHFTTVDRWVERFPNLLNFGRQGLFAHDNTHHALTMAYAASDCLNSAGQFDRNRWTELRNSSKPMWSRIDAASDRNACEQPLGLAGSDRRHGLAAAVGGVFGLPGGDDRLYIQHAFELSQGRLIPDTSSHWQARLGMLLPLAGLMRTWGASLGVIAAIPLVWTLVSVVLGYVAGQAFYRDERVALLAALLISVFPLDVIFATQYFPDMALAALTGIAFLGFYMRPPPRGPRCITRCPASPWALRTRTGRPRCFSFFRWPH